MEFRPARCRRPCSAGNADPPCTRAPSPKVFFFGDGRRIALTSFSSLRLSTRPDVQTAFRGVRHTWCHGCRAWQRLPFEPPRYSRPEMRQRHRAILDERDRLALLLHRHHDIETRGAKTSAMAGLQARFCDLDHATPFCVLGWSQPKPRSAHQLAELPQAPDILGLILLGETRRSGPHRGRCALAAPMMGLKHLDPRAPAPGMVRSTSSTAIGRSFKFHQMLRGIHRPRKSLPKWQDGPAPCCGFKRPQLQFDLRGEGRACLPIPPADAPCCFGAFARHQRVRDYSRRRGAATFGNFLGDLSGLRARRDRAGSRNRILPRCRLEFRAARSRGTSPKCSRVAVGQCRVPSTSVCCRAWCRIGGKRPPQELLPGHCRRWVARGCGWKRRPETTGRVFLSCRFEIRRARFPVRPRSLRFSTSSETMRFRCLEKIDDDGRR